MVSAADMEARNASLPSPFPSVNIYEKYFPRAYDCTKYFFTVEQGQYHSGSGLLVSVN